MAVGALAGAIDGAVPGGAGLASDIDDLLDLEPSALGLGFHLLSSVAAGALFGSLFCHQPGAYAALISNSPLHVLLLWTLRPLTLVPLLYWGLAYLVSRSGPRGFLVADHSPTVKRIDGLRLLRRGVLI